MRVHRGKIDMPSWTEAHVNKNEFSMNLIDTHIFSVHQRYYQYLWRTQDFFIVSGV